MDPQQFNFIKPIKSTERKDWITVKIKTSEKKWSESPCTLESSTKKQIRNGKPDKLIVLAYSEHGKNLRALNTDGISTRDLKASKIDLGTRTDLTGMKLDAQDSFIRLGEVKANLHGVKKKTSFCMLISN